MILPTLAACVVPITFGVAQDDPRSELPGPPAMAEKLQSLEQRYPQRAVRVPVGTSAQGQAIHALRLATTPLPAAKPALLLIGGLEHDRVFEAALVLELVDRILAADARGDAGATALLDALTIYAIPAPDPDGMARALTAPHGAHVGFGPDRDDDRDGRRGEDPWADVDGDGQVLWMRVPDPDGGWAADPHDPRANVEADPLAGLRASFRLEREGRDADGDGRVAEDPAGDRQFAANFPADWPEHEPRAGGWATQDPAVRALCDFVIAHEDLVMVHAIGAQDWMVDPPSSGSSSRGRVPGTGPTEEDLELIEEIAERYREATGVEVAESDGGPGSFQRWAYDHRGLWTFAVRPWSLPTEAPEAEPDDEAAPEASPSTAESAADGPDASEAEPELPGKPSDDAGRLAWIDATGESWRFVDWTPFEHPELGPVEIGGFAPGGLNVPPRETWDGILDGQLAFLYRLAELPAELTIESFEATPLADGVYELELCARNVGWLPTVSRAASRARVTRPARVLLDLPDGAVLLAGREIENLPVLAAEDSHSLRWLVKTDALDSLRADLVSATAGITSATPTEDAR